MNTVKKVKTLEGKVVSNKMAQARWGRSTSAALFHAVTSCCNCCGAKFLRCQEQNCVCLTKEQRLFG